MAAKYVVSDETMTSIADPLRDLAGRSDKLTPAEMAAAGNAATDEMETQADLIVQIQAALVGKAASGSGGDVEVYTGPYSVTPKTEGQTLETANKRMVSDVSVKAIPFYDTSNTAGGQTIYIGTEV